MPSVNDLNMSAILSLWQSKDHWKLNERLQLVFNENVSYRTRIRIAGLAIRSKLPISNFCLSAATIFWKYISTSIDTLVQEFLDETVTELN